MAVVMFTVCFLSATLTIICLHNDVYLDGGETFLRNACQAMATRALGGIRLNINRYCSLLQIKDGRLEFENEDKVFSGYTEDECNYIFVIRSETEPVLYTTSDSETRHLYGWVKVLDGASLVYNTIDSGYTEDFSMDFVTIGDAMTCMEELAEQNGFIGSLDMTLNPPGDVNNRYNRMFRLALSNDEGVTSDEVFMRYPEIKDGDWINLNMILSHGGLSESAGWNVNSDPEIKTNTGEMPNTAWGTDTPNYDDIVLSDRDFTAFADGETITIRFGKDGCLYVDGNSAEFMKDFDMTDLYQLREYIVPEDYERYMNVYGSYLWVRSINLNGTYSPAVDRQFYVDVYVPWAPQVMNNETYMTVGAVRIISEFSGILPIVMLISGILLILCWIFLAVSAGHRYGSDTLSVSLFDKIPFEIFILIGGVMAPSVYYDYIELVYRGVFIYFYNYRIFEPCFFAAIIVGLGLLLTLIVYTLSARLKTKKFWRYTFTGWIVMLIGKIIGLVRYVFSRIKFTWKAVIGVAVLFLFDFLVINSLSGVSNDRWYIVIISFLAIHFAVTVLVILWIVGFSKIEGYAKKISDGESDVKLDKKYLYGELKSVADTMEGVGEGVRKAVDEKMRSERLKTELITNVSHDLKTPLTSIVNYVDILSKDDISDEKAIEHIEIIKRQSARMKKLIEDLVEVSKASSGNVAVNLERTDVNLLIAQCVAEYEDRISAGGLATVVRIPERKIIAELDGRLMWRVLDNLLGNICKYALAGTRVYITAEDKGEDVKISFKNVSRSPIDITGEDLMERFVRGDSSRNTEGSGLGLSIAKSLCDLQGVGFSISVDGDLFKAELTVKKCSDDELLSDEPIEYQEKRREAAAEALRAEENVLWEEEKSDEFGEAGQEEETDKTVASDSGDGGSGATSVHGDMRD